MAVTGTIYDPTMHTTPGMVSPGSVTQLNPPDPNTTFQLAGNPPIGNQSASTAPAPIAPVAGYNPALGETATSAPTGYTSTPYAVPKEGLVEERIKGIVSSKSPLMQQAEKIASQKMADRGLVLSSLNTTAGQEAVLNAALPIASADAQSITNAANLTAGAKNDASKFGADAQNTASNLNAQLANSMNTTNANAANTALSATTQAENVRMLALIDNNTKMALAQLDTQNRQLLQTNANSANMYQETVRNIAAISVDQTLDQKAKDNAVRTQINLLKEGLAATQTISQTIPSEIQELDLGQFFNTY